MFLKEKCVDENDIVPLSDYLNDRIIQDSKGEESKVKKNIVLYNQIFF